MPIVMGMYLIIAVKNAYLKVTMLKGAFEVSQEVTLLTFTCSESPIETIKKSEKYVQS